MSRTKDHYLYGHTPSPEIIAKILGKPLDAIRKTWSEAELPGAASILADRERSRKRLKAAPPEPTHREFFSIQELGERWRCSRGTVYNRLRKAGTKVMDWSGGGEKGKKAVRASDVREIENRRMKRLL